MTLQSISVTPTSNTIDVGSTVQLTTTGSYSDSTTTDITGLVNWTVSDTAIATVSSNGLVTGISNGAVTVTANSGALTDSVTINVQAISLILQSIEVASPNSNVNVGGATKIYAIGTFSDNSFNDISESATLSLIHI